MPRVWRYERAGAARGVGTKATLGIAEGVGEDADGKATATSTTGTDSTTAVSTIAGKPYLGAHYSVKVVDMS